nr:MAG TPA: Protein of unknown function DUF262 [Caudoviricetes sp.]
MGTFIIKNTTNKQRYKIMKSQQKVTALYLSLL